MIHAVRHNHHYKGKNPAGKRYNKICPAITRRDGDDFANALPEPHHDAHVEQAHDSDDIPVARFNSPFGTIVHAAHAAFAAERPERAVINGEDCFYRAVVDANVAFVAGIGGVERFGQDEPPDKEITDAYRGDQYILDDVAEGCQHGFPAENFRCKPLGDCFAMSVYAFNDFFLDSRVEGDPVRRQVDGTEAGNSVSLEEQYQRGKPECHPAESREEPPGKFHAGARIHEEHPVPV